MGYHTAREIPNYWTYAKRTRCTIACSPRPTRGRCPRTSSWCRGGRRPAPILNDPMSCVSNLAAPGHNAADGSKVWNPAHGEPRPYVWADITWLLYKAGVSAGGTSSDRGHACAAVRTLEGTETAPVQNPLPGFRTVRRHRPARQRAPEHGLLRGGARGHAPVGLVGDADRRTAPSTRRTTSGPVRPGSPSRERRDARAPRAVDAHCDLRRVGRLGRLLRPRAAARRRRERVGAARARAC